MTNITESGLLRILRSKRNKMYCMNDGNRNIDELINNMLPNGDECYKFISLSGGFSSVNFIKVVANQEVIEELTASTLRIGEKQFRYLAKLSKLGKLKKATFFIGSIMKQDAKSKVDKYDYYSKFFEFSKDHDWNSYVTNNHSKVILMRTSENHYVLESSSNLNDNPKIEQYSFENSKELYEFYYNFFDVLSRTEKVGGRSE